MPLRTISRRRPFRADLERLETRLALSLSIQFDYSYDDLGFFTANPDAKAVLQEAAQILGNPINDELAAIVPDVKRGNVWSEVFTNPSTGQLVTIENPTIPENTIVVYAAGSVSNDFAGDGGPGGFTARGDQAWNTLVSTRGTTGAGGSWGGMVSFNPSTDWSFATAAGTPDSNRYDFLTVALHELGHVLGIGTSAVWRADVDAANNTFTGPHAEAMNGGPVPLNSALDVAGEAADTHWASGLLSFGLEPSVDVAPLLNGVRKTFTSLDWAGLQDLGWHVDRAIVTIQPPATIPAGGGFGLTVSIEDPNDHVDTAYNGPVTVTLGIKPTDGRLSGTQTVNAVDGVARFSGLAISKGGTGYQIQVGGAGLGSAMTTPLDVTSDSLAVVSDEPPIPAPAPPISSVSAPTLSIVRAVALYSGRGRRKKLIGFEVDFGSPLDGSIALNAANYTITETFKRGKRTIAKRVRFRTGFGTNTDNVRLLLVGRHPFTRGGRLVVSSSGSHGNFLATDDVAFTILRNGRGVRSI